MNKNIIFRVNEDIVKAIEKETYLNPEKYMNNSHFIRIAIIKELRSAEHERKKKTK